jgi:hypothetical protein
VKIKCCCCGKQIVPYNQFDEYVAPGLQIKKAIRTDEGFCDECGNELDENGLFPEEAMIEERRKNND